MIAGFAIGFLNSVAFIGTFAYVNFVLAGPFGLTRMRIGLVYFVFVPSILLTPFAGAVANRIGARLTVILAFIVAALGFLLLVSRTLATVLTGIVVAAAGTFFAQAIATGFVSRMAGWQRAAWPDC